MTADLSHVDTWIFDLDNTLYPAECGLLALVNDRMTAFVVRETGLDWDEARALQHRYHSEHGATLSGLMAYHGVDPAAFLDEVHDISLDRLTPDPALDRALAAACAADCAAARSAAARAAASAWALRRACSTAARRAASRMRSASARLASCARA